MHVCSCMCVSSCRATSDDCRAMQHHAPCLQHQLTSNQQVQQLLMVPLLLKMLLLLLMRSSFDQPDGRNFGVKHSPYRFNSSQR